MIGDEPSLTVVFLCWLALMSVANVGFAFGLVMLKHPR